MRKILITMVLLVTSYLLLVTFSAPVFAGHTGTPPCNPTDPTTSQHWQCVVGGIKDPTGVPGNNGDEQISNFVSRIIELIYIVAALVFAFMILLGAFQWITSGGEKEAIAKSRARITHAIIGFVLLALSFVLINIISSITGIGVLRDGGFGGSLLPNQPQAPGVNSPLNPANQNNPNPFTNPFVPNDQNGTPGFNDPQFPGGNSNQNPCCPPASRRQNNQCVDVGTNLPVPELNPSACN